MTEGWCYGTMSVSAQSKGHFWYRGLWEMTPGVLLLILALTAGLSEPVCGEDNGSGESEEWTSVAITPTSVVTDVSWNSTITVHVQEEQLSEEDAKVTLEQTSTTKQIHNETRTKALNRTIDVNPTEKTLNYTKAGTVQGDQEENEETQDKEPRNTEEDNVEDMRNVFIIIAVCLVLALLLAAAVAGLLITRRRRKNNATDTERDPNLDDEDAEKFPMPMFEDDMPSVMELEMEDFEKWMIKEGNDISMDSKQRHPS